MNESVITLDDTVITAAVKMAEGNPGAITVMMELIKKKQEEGFIAIMHLDDMQIRGWKIWYGYKDYCKQDLEKFFDCIMSKDKDMQQFIDNFAQKCEK